MTLVKKCARCGEDHEVEFKKLTRPMQDAGYTHWAPCPNNGEPILMKMIRDSKPAPPPLRIIQDNVHPDKQPCQHWWTSWTGHADLQRRRCMRCQATQNILEVPENER